MTTGISLVGDYTTWNMVRSSDSVVKIVLVLLLLASLASWTVWLAKTVELMRARRRIKSDLAVLDSAQSLVAIATPASDVARAIAESIRHEVTRSGDLRNAAGAEGLKERVSVRLLSLESAFSRRMTRGTNLVASIGATAPFVGLFGTVWGIMESFIGIARSQTTNLAVVAPGIAEALFTTAMGLAAAVPAVLIYNRFVRSLSGYRALLADVSNAYVCLLSLDIERRLTDSSTRQPARGQEAPVGL